MLLTSFVFGTPLARFLFPVTDGVINPDSSLPSNCAVPFSLLTADPVFSTDRRVLDAEFFLALPRGVLCTDALGVRRGGADPDRERDERRTGACNVAAVDGPPKVKPKFAFGSSRLLMTVI